MAFLSTIRHLLKGVDVGRLLKEIDSLQKELALAKKELSKCLESITTKDNEILCLK